MEEPLPLTTFHMENEEHPLSRKAAPTLIKGETRNGAIAVLGQNEEVDGEEAACSRYDNTTSQAVLFALKTVVCTGL